MILNIEQITAHIRAHLHDNLTPGGIAAHFGVNRFTLSRRFRAETGLSLRDYIAALKIEQGIAPLIAGQPIIDSQLEAGHQSAATFSHRFRAHTGQAPREYRAQARQWGVALHAELCNPHERVFYHHSFDPQLHAQNHALTVRIGGVTAPQVVFAGLFPEPIPRGVPVIGAALFRGHTMRIDAVPDGCYYLLGCEIVPSLNPLRYFRLDHCLRGKHDGAITFPLPAPQTLELHLRPLQPSDPPITVNLPKLLFDYLRQRA